MKITFVIVSFNTHELTLKCLDSIYKFEKSSDFEIIVVDNASTDNSVRLIRKQFPQVKLISNENNVGFARANNQAIAVAQGQYIILLNSDTQLIENLSTPLTSHFHSSQTGATVPQLLNSDRSIQASVFRLPTLLLAIKSYWFNHPSLYAKYYPNSQSPTLVESAVMACMCIPRQIFHDLGDLDEKFFMYFEDLEFCRRLSKNNFQIIYDPQVKLIHHHGASGTANPNGWKRLIPGSKLYHGLLTHYLITFVLWSGQKLHPQK